MIKISKDNLFVWSKIIPIAGLIIHAWLIFVCIMMNFWPLYIAYGVVGLGQFFFAKAWRYFLLRDVYLSKDFNKIIFKGLKGDQVEFNRNQIAKQATYFGITNVLIDENGDMLKFYFIVSSKENLDDLMP
jgi:hypothetical protein